MKLLKILSFGLYIAVLSCSPRLTRPIVGPDNCNILASYYISKKDTLPKTLMDCKYLIKKVGPDELLKTVCLLNLKRYDEAKTELEKIEDICIKKIVEYDIAVDNGLKKSDRFKELQNLFDCSNQEDFKKMIQTRSKLAHYE